MSTEMNNMSGGMKVIAVINSLLLVAVGFYLLFRPVFVVWLMSTLVLVHGIKLIISYFTMKDLRSGWGLFTGILSVLLGIVMLFSGPETRVMGVLMVEIVVAIWAIFAGIERIIENFSFKKKGAGKSIWGVIGGIMLFLFGIFLFMRPVFGAASLVFAFAIFVGISLIFAGFSSLADTFIRKPGKMENSSGEAA